MTWAAGLLAVACHTTSPAPHHAYDPAHDLGPLFHDVQVAGVFPDSKTFVDSRPLLDPSEIVRRYDTERAHPGFDLAAFVAANFAPPPPPAEVPRDTGYAMEEHIRALWPVLSRGANAPDERSSLLPLPHSYIVPGGRFREVYYWDSYFTMLGLVESGRVDLVQDMLDNFAWLIRTTGHIPNGNRTYYLGRSQPPYFGAMVGLYALAIDTAHAIRYLEALEAEHAYWMDGAGRVGRGQAIRRVVRLPNGAILNRYWDDFPEPRPESYREDEALGRPLSDSARLALYRNIRATAESGWDFSSRWMRDPHDLRTLETTDLAPVDLNALLWKSERMIAALRRARARIGDAAVAARYEAEAEARQRALRGASWDADSGWYYDVRWRTAERVTDRPTLAATSMLFFGLAQLDHGATMARRLESQFLRPGGFTTTLVSSGQQWDAPNGWAPLEWLAIQGLHRYGQVALAERARDRWLALNRRVYRETGRMMEKYDVVDTTRAAGGGEYPTQDGFGWTNGVALALIADRWELPVTPRSSSRPTRLPTSVSALGYRRSSKTYPSRDGRVARGM